jgi:hypothetical protein
MLEGYCHLTSVVVAVETVIEESSNEDTATSFVSSFFVTQDLVLQLIRPYIGNGGGSFSTRSETTHRIIEYYYLPRLPLLYEMDRINHHELQEECTLRILPRVAVSTQEYSNSNIYPSPRRNNILY